MTRLEIFNVMRQVVLTATGVPECILSDPNAPAPSGSYAAVEPKMNPRKRGQANTNYNTSATEDSVDTTVRRQLMVDCSINFYRDGAADYAELIHDANRIPAISELLFTNNLGWSNSLAVNNLTALQDYNFEQRREITVTLMYVPIPQVYVGNSIERIPYTLYDDEDNVLSSGEVSDIL